MDSAGSSASSASSGAAGAADASERVVDAQGNAVDVDALITSFATFTGIDDIERCRGLLSHYHWDLQRAVQGAFDERDAATMDDSHPPPPYAAGTTDGKRPLRNSAGDSSSGGNSSSSSGGNRGSGSGAGGANGGAANGAGGNAVGGYWTRQVFSLVWSLVHLLAARTTSVMDFFGLHFLSRQLAHWTGLRIADPGRRPADPAAAANRFTIEFEQLYGTVHPPFFAGSYMQALNTAKQSLKLFVVYLHCADHQDVDTFCRTTLANQALCDYVVSHDVIVWAGNVVDAEAYRVSETLGATSYPFLAVIAQVSSRMSIVARVEGAIAPEELIDRLSAVVERLVESLQATRVEREARERERQLREEQEREYRDALRADQEKERKAREEREARERELAEAERLIREERERAEREKQQRSQKEKELPPEPAANEPDITKISVRLSDGTRIERRFHRDTTIQKLYDYVDTKEQALKTYRLRTNVPRIILKDLTATLRSVNLFPSAAVIVEEDAD